MCCSLWVAPLCSDHCYGNIRTHNLLDEKENDPEHRRDVCCRGKERGLRTQKGCLLSGNLTDHGRYRREVIRRYAPGWGRSVLRVIRCTSCCASCSRSLSSYCTPQYGTQSRTLDREGPTARFLHDGGTYWKQSRRVFTGRGCERFREEFFVVLEAGGGCTHSTVHGKHRAVVC